MAITKVHVIEADAEVLGTLRRVRINAEDQTLVIYALPQEEAYDVLDRLTTGTLAAIKPPKGGFAPPPKGAPKASEEGSPLERYEATIRKVEVAQAEKDAEQSKSEKALAAAAALGEMVEPVKPVHMPGAEVAIPKEISRAQAAEANVAVKEPTEPERLAAEPDGELPEDIKGAKRFVQVLEWVMRVKALKPTDVEPLLAELTKMQPEVKVLTRVANLREKLESNLAAFTENAEG